MRLTTGNNATVECDEFYASYSRGTCETSWVIGCTQQAVTTNTGRNCTIMTCPLKPYENTLVPAGNMTLSAGESVNVSCAEGYGASTTCASNFSVQCGPSCAFPNTSCVAIRCSALPVINGVSIYGLVNGVPMRGMTNASVAVDPSGQGLMYGQTLKIDCDEGYTVDASTKVSALATCGADCVFDKTACVKVSGAL
jgi:hypothetical protein